MKKCAYCGRENTDETAYCRECGTAFFAEPPAPRASEVRSSSRRAPRSPEKQMLYGGIWCVGGIIVTVVGYQNAAHTPGGGTYIVAWGAIVFGAIQFFRGLANRGNQPADETDKVGWTELSRGTKLESEGRVQEALTVYREIAAKFPNTEAGRDATRSIESLEGKIR